MSIVSGNNLKEDEKKLMHRACQVFFEKGESVLSSFAEDVSQIGWAILLGKSVEIGRRSFKRDGMATMAQIASNGHRTESHREMDGKEGGEEECSIQDVSGPKAQDLTVRSIGAFSAPVLDAAAALSALLADWASFHPVARLPSGESFAAASLGDVGPQDAIAETSLVPDMPVESMGRAALAASPSILEASMRSDSVKKSHDSEADLRGRTKFGVESKMLGQEGRPEQKNDLIRMEKGEVENQFARMPIRFLGPEATVRGQSFEVGIHEEEASITRLNHFDSLSSLKPKETINRLLRGNLSVDGLHGDREHRLAGVTRLEQDVKRSRVDAMGGVEGVKMPAVVRHKSVEKIGSSPIVVSQREMHALRSEPPAYISHPVPETSLPIYAQERGTVADVQKIVLSSEFLPLKKGAISQVGIQESLVRPDLNVPIEGVDPIVGGIKYAGDQSFIQDMSIQQEVPCEIDRPFDGKKIEKVNVWGFDRRAQMAVEDVGLSKRGLGPVVQGSVNVVKPVEGPAKGLDVGVQSLVRIGNGFSFSMDAIRNVLSVSRSAMEASQGVLGKLTGSLMEFTVSVLSQVKERCDLERVGKGSAEMSLSSSVTVLPVKVAPQEMSQAPDVIVRKYAPFQIIENYNGNQQLLAL